MHEQKNDELVETDTMFGYKPGMCVDDIANKNRFVNSRLGCSSYLHRGHITALSLRYLPVLAREVDKYKGSASHYEKRAKEKLRSHFQEAPFHS